jgi:hypothetical protein
MLYPSGVKHLEEIKNAGYEMPAVNQIEVRQHSTICSGCSACMSAKFDGLAASFLSAKAYCRVLHEELDRRASILSARAGRDGQ